LKVVLASSSPRRSRLLTEAGLEFEVKHPQVDESRLGQEPPDDYVCRLAEAKARAVSNGESLVIGADTVVVLGNEFLNKPGSEKEAMSILRKLSGMTHTVYTGVSVVCPDCGKVSTDYDKTQVRFNDLTNDAILRYIKTGEPMDKAGAYGIQGMGSFLVRGIEGELDTVIGLPRKLLHKLLEEHKECLNKT
jgi:septum formation protein